MWFEQVKDWITWFFNLTLPVVGLSVGVLCILIYKIFSKTSFGKKQLNKVENDFNSLAKRSDAFIEKVEKTLKDIKETSEKEKKAISEYYETMLAQKQAKEDELESLFLQVCDCIHNEKVKNIVLEYKKKMDGHRTIMTEKIESVKAEYDLRLRALEEKIYGKEENSETTEE